MAECKYYKQVRQVSYDNGVTWISLDEYRKGDLYENDSPDCGGSITQYKWVNVSGEYTCVGTTKYQKTKKQQSTDGGQTWTDVNPPEYNIGGVIEYDSQDCFTPIQTSEYLSFIASENGTFRLVGNSVSYSLDSGSTWNTLASNTDSPTVQRGNKIMWKGNFLSTRGSIGRFSSSGIFQVEGNIMSLLYGDNFEGQTALDANGCDFMYMFSGCTKLTSAEFLILPATALTTACYAHMFDGCTSLTNSPRLPATRLAPTCYHSMFYECSNLVSVSSLPAMTLADACYQLMFAYCPLLKVAPELPATALTEFCYNAMFLGCRTLITAPELLAPTLLKSSYGNMFDGCKGLNYLKCLATDISADDCTVEWMDGVAKSGTFVKASSMNSWGRGVSGIPNNWTVQNA